MKTIIVFLLLIYQLPIPNSWDCRSQSQFQRTIGGTGSDYANSIIQTTDGGYAVAGYTNSFGAGNYDMYIVKLSSSFTIQWTKTVGGANDDEANSIIQTTDGGYAVAGYTNSFGAGSYDMYIVKLSSSGTLQWTRTVGGTGNDYAYSIIQTTDSGYVLAGTTSFEPGMCIVKLDAAGTLQWSKTVAVSTFEHAYSIIRTSDGGFAVAGHTGEGGYSNMFIVKFDGSGTVQWTRMEEAAVNVDDVAFSLIQTTDGGFAMAGYSTYITGLGPYAMFIVKLSSNAGFQWNRVVGGANSDVANSIIQTTDGGYAVAGYTNSFGAGNYDMYIVKLNLVGYVQWTKTVGGVNDDKANSIIQTTDGGYVIAGYTNSFGIGNTDIYIVKLDSNGNTCGNSTSPSSTSLTGGSSFPPYTFVYTPTPTVTTQSPTVSSGGTVTTLCLVGIQPISNDVPAYFKLYQNYPNPFNPTTNIKYKIPKNSYVVLRIYNIQGMEAATLVNEQLTPGTYEVKWDASNYPSGVYFYRLETVELSKGNAVTFTASKKMILVK